MQRKSANKIIELHTEAFAKEYKAMEVDPLMLQAVALLVKSNQSRTSISNRCGVSMTTMKRWEERKTRRPQAATLRFVLRALGFELKIVSSRPSRGD